MWLFVAVSAVCCDNRSACLAQFCVRTNAAGPAGGYIGCGRPLFAQVCVKQCVLRFISWCWQPHHGSTVDAFVGILNMCVRSVLCAAPFASPAMRHSAVLAHTMAPSQSIPVFICCPTGHPILWMSVALFVPRMCLPITAFQTRCTRCLFGCRHCPRKLAPLRLLITLCIHHTCLCLCISAGPHYYTQTKGTHGWACPMVRTCSGALAHGCVVCSSTTAGITCAGLCFTHTHTHQEAV